MSIVQYESKEQILRTINSAATDYDYKIALKNEGTQRLDIWEIQYVGKEIPPGALSYYRVLVEDAIKRENAVRESGRKYKDLLTKYSSMLDINWVYSQIEQIDRNERVSYSDQEKTIKNLQTTEEIYYTQEDFLRIARIAAGGGIGLIGFSILFGAMYYGFVKHK
jgi:hypothetical protein